MKGINLSSWSSREIIKMLIADGWFEVGCEGAHHQFEHKTKKGKVTVPHPRKDIAINLAKIIFKQAGISNYRR